MSLCSFLTTSESEIECFGECAFYNWEESGGVCPFKNLSGSKKNKLKELYQYDFFADDSINIKEIDEYIVEKSFI
jgi:hypothetical protein